MEAAEGEAVVPVAIIRGVDDGGIEVQAVRVPHISRNGRTASSIRIDAREAQSTVMRIGETTSRPPQRRKQVATIAKIGTKTIDFSDKVCYNRDIRLPLYVLLK